MVIQIGRLRIEISIADKFQVKRPTVADAKRVYVKVLRAYIATLIATQHLPGRREYVSAKLVAIKTLRGNGTLLGLKEAKDLIEAAEIKYKLRPKYAAAF